MVSQFQISITSKVHIIMRHVPDFIKRKSLSLGAFSEEAVESTHHSFDRHFDKYRIKDIYHTNYGTKLLAAILHYNSSNL